MRVLTSRHSESPDGNTARTLRLLMEQHGLNCINPESAKPLVQTVSVKDQAVHTLFRLCRPYSPRLEDSTLQGSTIDNAQMHEAGGVPISHCLQKQTWGCGLWAGACQPLF